MNCPVCGKDMGGLYWTHLQYEHGVTQYEPPGVPAAEILHNVTGCYESGYPCICGEYFLWKEARLAHFAEHGKECLFVWSLTQ